MGGLEESRCDDTNHRLCGLLNLDDLCTHCLELVIKGAHFVQHIFIYYAAM